MSAEKEPLHLDSMLCFAVYAAGHAFTRFYKPRLEALDQIDCIHTFPQFIAVMLSCKMVASETQMKYGTWGYKMGTRQEKWDRQVAFWRENEPKIYHRVRTLQKYYQVPENCEVDVFFSIRIEDYEGMVEGDRIKKWGDDYKVKGDYINSLSTLNIPTFRSHGNVKK